MSTDDMREPTDRAYTPMTDAYRAVCYWMAVRESVRSGDKEIAKAYFNDAVLASGRPTETYHMHVVLTDYLLTRGIDPTDGVLKDLAEVLFQEGAKAHTIMRDINAITGGQFNGDDMTDERDGRE